MSSMFPCHSDKMTQGSQLTSHLECSVAVVLKGFKECMSEWRGHLKSCPSLLRGTAKNIGQATKGYKGSLIQGWYLIRLYFSNWMRLICNNDQSVAWQFWHCRFCTILPSRANFHLLSTPNSIVTTGFNCQHRIRLLSSEYCNNWRLLPIAAFSQYTMHFTTSPISVSFNVRKCHCNIEQMTPED